MPVPMDKVEQRYKLWRKGGTVTIEEIAATILGLHCMEDPWSIALEWYLFGYRDRLSYVRNLVHNSLKRGSGSKWYSMGLDSCIRENVSYITRREIRKEAGDLNLTCVDATLEDIGLT